MFEQRRKIKQDKELEWPENRFQSCAVIFEAIGLKFLGESPSVYDMTEKKIHKVMGTKFENWNS